MFVQRVPKEVATRVNSYGLVSFPIDYNKPYEFREKHRRAIVFVVLLMKEANKLYSGMKYGFQLYAEHMFRFGASSHIGHCYSQASQ